MRMKGILDELRVEKDRVSKLREANRNLDKSSKIILKSLLQQKTLKLTKKVCRYFFGVC
jgi:hypothetical protein